LLEAHAGPLGARFEPASARHAAKLCAVWYASGAERVSSWWVMPEAQGSLDPRSSRSSVPRSETKPSEAAAGPHAGIVFQHWGFGSRDSFLAEALALARSGVVALLPNARGCGGRKGPRPAFRAAGPARAYAEQAVRDLRRGLDLLCEQADVDRARLGFVGHSLGASVGGLPLGADARIRAAVLVGGTGTISKLWLPRASAAERAALAPLDGAAWIGRTRAACFFRYGERDEFIAREDAVAYAAAAPGPGAPAGTRATTPSMRPRAASGPSSCASGSGSGRSTKRRSRPPRCRRWIACATARACRSSPLPAASRPRAERGIFRPLEDPP
jgi:dienelactone hydrolase